MTDEKAIEVIQQNCYVSNLLDLDETVMINTALDRAVDALKNPTGEWIAEQYLMEGDSRRTFRCSNCKCGIIDVFTFPYCPYCKATMLNGDLNERGLLKEVDG